MQNNLSASTATISVRLPIELAEQLNELSKATSRSKSFLTIQALQELLTREAWQIAEINSAIKDADAGDFASDVEMAELNAKWGYSAERDYGAR